MKNWKQIKRTELSAEYEDLEGESWDDMVASISRGFDKRYPVVLLDGEILDGWQRQRASIACDQEPAYADFPDVALPGETPEQYVRRVQDSRRHETEEMKRRRLERQRRGREERQKRIIESRSEGKSVRAIAEAEGVSVSTVHGDIEKASSPGVREVKSRTPDNGKTVVCEAESPKKVVGLDGKTYTATKPEKAKKVPDVIPTEPGESSEVSAETEDEKPWVDDWGIPITKEAEKAFLQCSKFDDLLSLLRKARQLYKEIADSPAGAYLCRPGTSLNTRDGFKHAGIETAILNVKDCKPTLTICPYAYNPHGDHKDCFHCKGCGWSRPIGKNESVTDEMKQAAKRAHGVG